MQHINDVPEAIRPAVRNHGGGHVNHSMLWQIMTPGGGGELTGAFAQALRDTFGSFEVFKAALNEVATKRFGSGWAWLVLGGGGTHALKVLSTANQDSPLMEGLYPVMGIDVWEHAYYLTYQNRRPDYLDAWWHVVNWKEVATRYERGRSLWYPLTYEFGN
jgi:Fe-Mn family superoxide dismutase